eukprot:gene11690-4924_t
MDDPNKFTIPQLKTKLTDAGIALPTSRQSKAFYVELYKANILGEHDIKATSTPYQAKTKTNPETGEKSIGSTRVKSRAKKRDREKDVSTQLFINEQEDEQSPKKQKTDDEEFPTLKSGQKKKQDEMEEDDIPTPKSSPQNKDDKPQLKRSEVISLGTDEDEDMTESENQQEEEKDIKQRKLDEFIEIRKSPSPSNTPPKRSSPAYQDTTKQTRLFNFTGEQPEKVLPPPLTSEWMQEEPKAKPIDDGKKQTRIDDFNKKFDTEFDFKKPRSKKRQTLAPSTILVPTDANRRRSDTHLPRRGTPFPGRTRDFMTASNIENVVDSDESEEYEGTDDFLKKKQDKYQAKNYLLQFILGIVIMIILGTSYILAYSSAYPYPRYKFCNSDNDPTSVQQISKDCQPCPNFGYCGQGRLLECETPYVLNKELFICSENEEITNHATSVVKILQKSLSTQTGKFECKESTKKGYTLSEVTKKVNETLDLKNEMLGHVMDKLVILMKKSSKELGISTEEIEQPISINSNETKKETIFYSENPELSLGCRLKKKFSEYKILISLITLLVFIIGILNLIATKRVEDRYKFEDLVTEVKTRLKDQKSCVMVHLRDSLAEEYGDQIEVETVWSGVELAISKDSRIHVGTSEENGNIVWEWTAGTTENDLNRQLFK